jgi:hypothetical protein
MGYGRLKKFLDKENMLYLVIAEEVEKHDKVIRRNYIKNKKRFGWSPWRFKQHICPKMLVYNIVFDELVLDDLIPFESVVKMALGDAGHKVIQNGVVPGRDYGEFQIVSVEEWIPQNKYAIFGRTDMLYYLKSSDTLIVLDFKFKFGNSVYKVDEYYYPQMNVYMHLMGVENGEFMYFWFNDFGKLEHKNFKCEYDRVYMKKLLKNIMYAALCMKHKFVPPAECDVFSKKTEKAKSMYCPYWKVCNGNIKEKLLWERSSYVLKQMSWCL